MLVPTDWADVDAATGGLFDEARLFQSDIEVWARRGRDPGQRRGQHD